MAFVEAIGTGAAGSWSTVMTAFAKRAQLRLNAGDWAGAEDLIERAEELRELWRFDDFVSVLLVHAISARIAIQRGDFDRGRESLVHAQLVRPLANHAAPWLSVDALLNLSRAYLADLRSGRRPAGPPRSGGDRSAPARHSGTLTAQLVEVRARLAGCHGHADRLVRADRRRAARPAVSADLPVVPGDRRAADDLAQHGQDPRDVDLRKAVGVLARRGGRTSRGDGPARAISRAVTWQRSRLERHASTEIAPLGGVGGARGTKRFRSRPSRQASSVATVLVSSAQSSTARR